MSEEPEQLSPSEKIELELFRQALQDHTAGPTGTDISQLIQTACDCISNGMSKDDALRGLIECLISRVKSYRDECLAHRKESEQWAEKWKAAVMERAGISARAEMLEHSLFIRSRSAMTGRLPKAYPDEELAKMFAPWWENQDTTGLSPREVCLLETIVDRNLRVRQMQDDKALTCIYCGEAYAYNDASAEQLHEHIKACEKHPLSHALAEIKRVTEDRDDLSAGIEACHRMLDSHYGVGNDGTTAMDSLETRLTQLLAEIKKEAE